MVQQQLGHPDAPPACGGVERCASPLVGEEDVGASLQEEEYHVGPVMVGCPVKGSAPIPAYRVRFGAGLHKELEDLPPGPDRRPVQGGIAGFVPGPDRLGGVDRSGGPGR